MSRFLGRNVGGGGATNRSSRLSCRLGSTGQRLLRLRSDTSGERRAVEKHLVKLIDAIAWNEFLDSFVDDEELIARVKAKSPR